MTKVQQAHALADYFAKAHKKFLGFNYKSNRHREKWGYQDMLDDLGLEQAKRVIDWYFKTDRKEYSAADLHRNYDRLREAMDDYNEDMAHQEKLMEATKLKVEEFRRRRESGLN